MIGHINHKEHHQDSFMETFTDLHEVPKKQQKGAGLFVRYEDWATIDEHGRDTISSHSQVG